MKQTYHHKEPQEHKNNRKKGKMKKRRNEKKETYRRKEERLSENIITDCKFKIANQKLISEIRIIRSHYGVRNFFFPQYKTFEKSNMTIFLSKKRKKNQFLNFF